MFTALDDPTRQGLPWNIDALTAQYLLETMKRQTIDVLGGQQHGQYAGAGHALLDQLSGLVGCHRCGFAVTATVDLTDMLDHTDLHWNDFELFADLFTDGMLAAPASAGQFMLGQFVDDFNARQIGWQRIALATALGGGNHLFISGLACQLYLVLRFVEQRHLRRCRIDGLLRLSTEQALP